MDIREYRRIKGLTQPQLAKELSGICEGIDAPLISKMERGICEPPEVVKLYIEAQSENQKQTVKKLSQSQADILERLMNSSRLYPATRQELVILAERSDRMVRRDIATMRDMGIRICSDSNNCGYWLAKSESDYKLARRELVSRIKSLSHTLKAMDNYCEGQIEYDIQSKQN